MWIWIKLDPKCPCWCKYCIIPKHGFAFNKWSFCHVHRIKKKCYCCLSIAKCTSVQLLHQLEFFYHRWATVYNLKCKKGTSLKMCIIKKDNYLETFSWLLLSYKRRIYALSYILFMVEFLSVHTEFTLCVNISVVVSTTEWLKTIIKVLQILCLFEKWL